MPLDDIGNRGYLEATGVATLTLTPLPDRGNILTRLLIDKVNAGDVWRIKCAGKELAAFDIQTTGNQQPLANAFSAYPKNNDLFEVVPSLLGIPLIYPVPHGQTLTVSSDGAATADISMEFQEVAPGEISPAMMNHPAGNRIVAPVIGYVNANVTAAGEAKFDTEVSPSWFPSIFTDGSIPAGWIVRVLAAFLEGGGVNTFSGAANHASATTYLGVRRNGQIMYTRSNAGGIPLYGSASAAGSANVVVGTDQTPYPPFQEFNDRDYDGATLPLVLQAGNNHQFRLGVAGDVTGGASYGSIRQMFLCDVTYPTT